MTNSTPKRGGGSVAGSLSRGDVVELLIEKPAAGGGMIARHGGQVVLVGGAIPGERVRALIDRVERRLAFASVQDVLEASPQRRDPGFDSLCGGCLYAHVAYEMQVALKSAVIIDAFTRIGRIPLEGPVTVAPSPERGYRMRARMHVHAGRAGFFREGTHELCDPKPTGQLLDASINAVQAALTAIGRASEDVVSIEVSENVAGDERAIHVEGRAAAPLTPETLGAAVTAAGLTGASSRSATGAFARAGHPVVSDPLSALTGGRAPEGALQRHAASFFQGNRYLLAALVTHVMDAVPAAGEILDLYAGVGLFAVSLSACGRRGIVAVEGDRESGADLLRNAAPYGEGLHAVVGLVEDHLRRERPRAATVIVDPPRTGVSAEAIAELLQLAAGRIIYVSCDPPTLARDARRLLDRGYALTSLHGFDLFPNTPHVEVVAVFDRASS
jgi:23S rRNA (uracil1939-C5)-methyltransferase